MSRSPSTHFLMIVGFAALLNCGFVAQLCGEETPPPTTEVQALADQLVDWKKSFHNFRVVTRFNNPGEWIRRRPELAAPGALDGYYQTEEWLYSDDGRYRLEARSYENGALIARHIYGNDHERLFSAKYQGSMDVPATIQTGPISNGHQPNQGWNLPLASLHIGGIQWFGASVGKWEVARYEDLDGVRCAVVQPPNSRNSEFYLDPEHDVLIKLRKNAGMGGSSEFRVDEFRQLNHGRWFPWRGRSEFSKETVEWEVQEAEVNLDLTDADFAPPTLGPLTTQSEFKTLTPVPPSQVKLTGPPPGDNFVYWLSGAGILLTALMGTAIFLYRRNASRPGHQTEAIEEEHPPLPISVALFAPWRWPQWNRRLLVGVPALLILYIVSIGPVLVLERYWSGRLMPVAVRVYYPLLAIRDELPPWSSSPLDNYAQLCGPWRRMLADYRNLQVQQERRAEPDIKSVVFAAALATGLVIYLWRKRTLAERPPSTN